MSITIQLFLLLILLITFSTFPIQIIKLISRYLRRHLIMSQDNVSERERPAELNPHIFDNCHDQAQSPLFYRIPPEIRAEIFAYALTEFEDTTQSYSPDT